MKCKREDCQNTAAWGQVYCSKDCAPYGNLGLTASPSAKGTGRSFYRASGAQSVQSSAVELLNEHRRKKAESRSARKEFEARRRSMNEPAAPATLSFTEIESTPNAAQEQRGIENMRTESSESGTPATANTPFEKSPSADTAVIPSEDSTQISIDVNAARSVSMNLIDSSVQELKNLMHAAAKSAQRQDHVNPQLVGAACNAAKQMYGLLRLKLDILKEVRKNV